MKRIVIVGIDGTISKVGDRLKYLNQTPKDWDSFYKACDEDEPIDDVLNLVYTLDQEDYDIIFCTGRRSSERTKTIKWIDENIVLSDYKLLMRPTKDHRHDTIVKPELLENHGIPLDNIMFVLEDRNSMVAKWRELGLTCLQVAEGDF